MSASRRYPWLRFQGGVDWVDVDPELLDRLNRLGRARRQVVTVTSGFRAREKQAQLYDDYVHHRVGAPPKAAPPGHSEHESGHAVDAVIGGRPIANVVPARVLGKYGLVAPVKGDPVHLQLSGQAPAKSAASSAPSAPASTGRPFVGAEGAAVPLPPASATPFGPVPVGPAPVAPAGAVPAGGFNPRQYADTWRLIAGQTGASAETQDYATAFSG